MNLMNLDTNHSLQQPAEFHKTHWSLVLRAAQTSAPGSMEALEKLCVDYWYPLYAFVRRRGGSAADAEDSTQAFFAKLLEKNTLAAANPAKGRFRSFLITAMKNFLADEFDKAKAQKRGGGKKAISLDAEEAEHRYKLEPVDSLTPETIFERRWALELLDRAQHRLREEYVLAGNAALFDALQTFHSGDKAESSYAEVAGRLGMAESTLRSHVHRMNRHKGQLIREEIDEEIRYLMSVIGR